MKKSLVSWIMVLAMVLGTVAMSVASFAAVPAAPADKPGTGFEVLKGTPIIDGQVDDLYFNSARVADYGNTDVIPNGYNGVAWADKKATGAQNTADIFFLYDNDYLYICAVTKDDTIIERNTIYFNGSNPLYTDNIEIRLTYDGTKDKDGAPSLYQWKLGIDCGGVRCYGLDPDLERLQFYKDLEDPAKKNDYYRTTINREEGYWVAEIKVPRSMLGTDGFLFKLEETFYWKAQLNDIDDNTITDLGGAEYKNKGGYANYSAIFYTNAEKTEYMENLGTNGTLAKAGVPFTLKNARADGQVEAELPAEIKAALATAEGFCDNAQAFAAAAKASEVASADALSQAKTAAQQAKDALNDAKDVLDDAEAAVDAAEAAQAAAEAAQAAAEAAKTAAEAAAAAAKADADSIVGQSNVIGVAALIASIVAILGAGVDALFIFVFKK